MNLPSEHPSPPTNPILVSVIIPVYNGEAFLSEAIESILRQAYRPLEIIVVDDGSTDGTREVAARFAGVVRYAYQSNRGPSAARNHGIRMARGEIISFLDSDDLWSEDKLSLQLPLLFADSTLQVIQGQTQLMQLSECPPPQFEKIGRPGLMMKLCSTLFRKSIFETVGLFDETMRYSEDVDWIMRAREQAVPMATVEQVVLFYRRHGGNVTNDRALEQRGFALALKKSIDRRRQQAATLSEEGQSGPPGS